MTSVSIDKLEKGKQKFSIEKISGHGVQRGTDIVIKEAPLEIAIAFGAAGNRKREILSVTMRTPGDDFNMVTGFLFAEHIIHRSSEIVSIRFTGNYDEESLQENSLLVELSPEVKVDLSERKKFLTNSACGFCGRGAFDISQNEGVYVPWASDKKIFAETLYQLPNLLQSSQGLFAETGGSHAVALLTVEGTLEKIFEDVGRHNAMDKLIGFMLKQQSIPLTDRIALFSGRLSYELVQKSLAAGIPVVCSIGAPTSLAIELASDYNMTVIGFLKKDRMNIYCGEEKIAVI
ncbi:MAG TPA: formate dehydrogenase accessory sulfurtransferase FdhD [Chitinophagales bacterium]|nr:formate dehydrogenase accessory sulfurtransferase FdhD [Chitinophagales bacterium]